MNLVLESPVKLRIPRAWEGSNVEAELREDLGYRDQRVVHEYLRWKRVQSRDNSWPGGHPFVREHGRAALDAKVEELRQAQKGCLLMRDDKGLWVPSGLYPRLRERYGVGLTLDFPVPAVESGPSWTPPSYEPYRHQVDAVEVLTSARHGAVELATGSGKSMIAAMLLKYYGLPAVVACPTLSIAEQLLSDLKAGFGEKAVGQFFGGKKQFCRITVAVSASLNRVAPDTKEWTYLSSKSVLCCDESHMWAADTLQDLSMGLLADVPYRFFLSGTQMRGDGLDLVLEGVTGEVLMRLSVRDAVARDVLEPPRFFQFSVESRRDYGSDDPIRMNRVHLHRNPEVYKVAADLANRFVDHGRRVLVLVEEVSQFAPLLKRLRHPAGFAHGGVTAKNRDEVPEAYRKSDPAALVAALDHGMLPILIGTSAVQTGTDFKSVGAIIDLVGGKSEVRLHQCVGRGTRKFPGKSGFYYVDFNIANVPILAKQAATRRKIMNQIYGPVEEARWNP